MVELISNAILSDSHVGTDLTERLSEYAGHFADETVFLEALSQLPEYAEEEILSVEPVTDEFLRSAFEKGIVLADAEDSSFQEKEGLKVFFYRDYLNYVSARKIRTRSRGEEIAVIHPVFTELRDYCENYTCSNGDSAFLSVAVCGCALMMVALQMVVRPIEINITER